MHNIAIPTRARQRSIETREQLTVFIALASPFIKLLPSTFQSSRVPSQDNMYVPARIFAPLSVSDTTDVI